MTRVRLPWDVAVPGDLALEGDMGTPLGFGPFVNQEFRLLFGSNSISSVGDQFTIIALPWLVLQLTHDPAQLGLVLAVIVSGVAPVAGALAGALLKVISLSSLFVGAGLSLTTFSLFC